MIKAHTLGTFKKAQRACEGILPFLLAQTHCEKLLDEKAPRGPTPRDKALENILRDVMEGREEFHETE